MKKLVALFAIGLVFASPALGQEQWPTKPIRIISGSGPGGSSDTLGRIFGAYFAKQAGQNWLMDNKPGAGSTISSEAARTSKPDGYNFYLTQVAAFAVAPYIYENVTYDPVKDFEPVSKFLDQQSVFFVRKNDERFNSLQDVIAAAKREPGKLKYAVSAIGTTTAMSTALLRSKLGLDMVMVPYKSSADPTLSVLRGDTDFAVENIQAVMGQADQLKMLAVTSLTRSPSFPNTPTVQETGVPDFNTSSWFGLVAPKGTPKPIVDKMASIMRDALKDPETKLAIERLGATPDYLGPDEFGKFIAVEMQKWKAIIAGANIPKQ